MRECKTERQIASSCCCANSFDLTGRPLSKSRPSTHQVRDHIEGCCLKAHLLVCLPIALAIARGTGAHSPTQGKVGRLRRSLHLFAKLVVALTPGNCDGGFAPRPPLFTRDPGDETCLHGDQNPRTRALSMSRDWTDEQNHQHSPPLDPGQLDGGKQRGLLRF